LKISQYLIQQGHKGDCFLELPDSGVAGPLAAHGGGQICRPFVLGF